MENVRKCIFIYKNSLRKTKEIENRIFKIIREEKRKTINYRKLQKRTISYKNNRKSLYRSTIIRMGKLTKRVENENAYLSYRIKIQKTLGFN